MIFKYVNFLIENAISGFLDQQLQIIFNIPTY